LAKRLRHRLRVMPVAGLWSPAKTRDAVIVRLGWNFRSARIDSCAFVASIFKARLP
jgi:hypothetical protein